MSKSPGQRKLIPLSCSPSNPDAVLVMQALQDQHVPKGQRSACLWAWAAGYLRGEGSQLSLMMETSPICDEELDMLMDDF